MKNKTKKRLFVDMDGTLAVWKAVNEYEDLYQKDWFRSMHPQTNVIDAVKRIIKTRPDIEVYLLSAVLPDSIYAIQEKVEWLKKFFPQLNPSHYIFTDNGHSKSDFVPDGIRKTDTLLDDYTVNLTDWSRHANAIKLMNGINGTNGTWKGPKVYANENPVALAENIINLMEE